MGKKKILILGMIVLLTFGNLCGCNAGNDKNLNDVFHGIEPIETESNKDGEKEPGGKEPEEKEPEEKEPVGETDQGEVKEPESEVTELTMFIAAPGVGLDEDNEIREIIAGKTGVCLTEKWMDGYDPTQALESLMAEERLPDLIDVSYESVLAYENGLLVPWDEYLEKYPALKSMYTDEEWDEFRMEDGHIYFANVFGNVYGDDRSKEYDGEAFWIQTRVLKEAGYPKISTLDEYFDLIDGYSANHQSFTNPAGEEVDIIPYTCLCDDWRYYSIENAPGLLDGYRPDGQICVSEDESDIFSYNDTPTARRYFERLNEEYQKGVVDKEFDTQTNEEYIEKILTGAVLGMCDQAWNFDYFVDTAFKENGLAEMGCEYVPLALTIDAGLKQHYDVYEKNTDILSGCAVTKDCKDPDAAFKFLNDMLSREIHDLRFWGVEGVDYLVDENGYFYRTKEMRENCGDEEYQKKHMCTYSYLPQWRGTSEDGKNARIPEEQKGEYFDSISVPLRECFEAYNVESYREMLGSEKEWAPKWYPLNSVSSGVTDGDYPGLVANQQMFTCKHEWLPKVVKAENFEKTWDDYMDAYKACKPEDYVNMMAEELESYIYQ